jgi:hypothetical protein
MNGFPLVLLGVVLFVVAYALLKIQSKMKEVTNAIDMGFKTIEDGITQNLLGPNGALTKATDAVDHNYLTIKNGLDQNVLGPQGLLSKSREIMNFANNICIDVSNDIVDGKLILQNDIRKTTGDIETILLNTGTPLRSAGTWFIKIGNDIDIDIAGAHPLQGIAQPFKDVGKTCDDIGLLVLDARSDLKNADTKIQKAEASLQKISDKVKALGPEIIHIRDYVDTTFTNGVNNSMDDLEHLTDSVKTIFSTMENGAQTSVNNLKNANAYLDSQLNNMFRKQYIVGLLTAGILLIMAGVALGL